MPENAQTPGFIPLDHVDVSPLESSERAAEFYQLMNRRRTVREYSGREVPFELIETAIATAGTAPSGANMQPWRFVVIKAVPQNGCNGIHQTRILLSHGNRKSALIGITRQITCGINDHCCTN